MIDLDDAVLAAVCGGYSPDLFAQMQKAISMGLTVNSTWTGQHGDSSAGWSHYNGRAFDSIGPDKTMTKLRPVFDELLSSIQVEEK